MCTAIGKRIQLDNFWPHVLRHTFGYDLAAAGYRLEHIAELMGHSNVNFTRIYTRSNMKERRNVVESLSEEREDS
jgi:site-specific recombinase XerD